MKDFDFKALHIGRRSLLGAGTCFLLINACGAKPVRSSFDVVLFNYLERPIFEVLIDGAVDENSTPYPATGTGTKMGVELTLGFKKVTWILDGPPGTADNGKVITSKNSPELKTIKSGKFLGVHIYPDYTVDLIPTVNFPLFSDRGLAEMRRSGRDRG